MRTSIVLILLAAASGLVGTGYLGFGSAALAVSHGPVQAVFAALPRETAFAAPLVALGLIALAYWILRILGMIITVAGIAMALVAVAVLAFGDETRQIAGLILGVGN